jgi:hypothetical protein
MDFDISVRVIVTIALKGLDEFKKKEREKTDDLPLADAGVTVGKGADKPVDATQAEGGALIGRARYTGGEVFINDIGIPSNFEGGQQSGDEESGQSAAGEDLDD